MSPKFILLVIGLFLSKIMPITKVLLAFLLFVSTAVGSVAGSGEEQAKTKATAKMRVKEITQRIKENRQEPQAYADRASAKMELGNAFGAIKDYNTALDLAPGNQTFLQSRGNAFLLVEAFKEALNDFNTALLSSKSVSLVYDRAVARYHLGDLPGTMTDLDHVILTDPNHAKAYYNRAVVKMDLNQNEAAVADLNMFLQLNPNHAEALLVLAMANQQINKIAQR